MNDSLLRIENLSIDYSVEKEVLKAVDNISLSINRGESLGIIGESGSGKTSMAMAIMGLVKSPGIVKGNILFKDKNLDKDINKLSNKQLNFLRWSKMAIVFQNSLDILNPLLTIHEQICEVLKEHTKLNKKEIDDKIIDLLIKVGLDPKVSKCYPHELSGGMRQRVLIAMGISCEPELLVVDEPTSALDMVSKNHIIKLLLEIQKENNLALIVISHELDTILRLTSKICVMYNGSIIEKGNTEEVIKNPAHVYTKGLLNSSPSINPFGDMWGIPQERKEYKYKGCPFENRCTQRIELCKEKNQI